MPAEEHLSGLQFEYRKPEGEGRYIHQLTARTERGSQLGTMLWSNKQVLNIGVSADQQRRGVATALWNEGHRLAGEVQRIPQPKHSADRTNAGDAWARSVGGRLPRRKR
jgi:hypothetical protein